MKRADRTRPGGYTLVEMLMAMGVSGIVITGMMMGSVALQRSFAGTLDYAIAQNDQSRISDYLAVDMRRALEVTPDGSGGVTMTLPNFYNSDGTVKTPTVVSTMGWPAKKRLVVDSFDSNDSTKSTLGLYDSAKRQSNGDIGSNAFPVKHNKTMDLNINNNFVFGDVWNNYSSIKGVSSSYFNGTTGPATNTNALIQTTGNAVPTGTISTNYFRDLPRIKAPTWTTADRNVGVLDKKDSDQVVSANPAAPTKIIATSVKLDKDTFVIKLPPGATAGYAEMWVQGDMSMKDGGIIQVEPGVHLTVYFQGDLKIEDKKKGAGFDVQSDDAADLILLGVEQSDITKKKNDQNESDVYTPYKATGNIVLKDADLVASLYAPDHNLVIDVKGAAKRDKDNKGKMRNRLQTGVDVYGSFVARNIHAKGPANLHYDEQLANAGPVTDVGYVSWFENLNLDRR